MGTINGFFCVVSQPHSRAQYQSIDGRPQENESLGIVLLSQVPAAFPPKLLRAGTNLNISVILNYEY